MGRVDMDVKRNIDVHANMGRPCARYSFKSLQVDAIGPLVSAQEKRTLLRLNMGARCGSTIIRNDANGLSMGSFSTVCRLAALSDKRAVSTLGSGDVVVGDLRIRADMGNITSEGVKLV